MAARCCCHAMLASSSVALLWLSLILVGVSGFRSRAKSQSEHIRTSYPAGASSGALFAESAVSHDYEYLDSGNQRRLERFGDTLVVRPCPSATWNAGLARSAWRKLRWCTRMENGEEEIIYRGRTMEVVI